MINIATHEEFVEFCLNIDNKTIIRPLHVGRAVYYFAFRMGEVIAHYVDRDLIKPKKTLSENLAEIFWI